jgi:hypothetical protein
MYHYSEHYLPIDRAASQRFMMDPYGDIYTVNVDCPKGGLTDTEIVRIVADARSGESDLPAAPRSFTTVIERTKCHHIYREIPKSDPEKAVSITIGPYGEIVAVRKNGKIVE